MLSHQSESQSDTKTEPFESASDSESLSEDCTPPSDNLLDRGTHWRDTEVSAANSQEQDLIDTPESDPEEELDLPPDSTTETYQNEDLNLTAVSGEEQVGCSQVIVDRCEHAPPPTGTPQHPGDWQDAMGIHMLQPAKHFGGLSAFSRQKSRSESCLGIPVARPILLCCCELGQGWLHNRNRAMGLVLPGRVLQAHTIPSRAPQMRKESGSVKHPDLFWPPSDFDAPCQPPLGISCFLCIKCHGSTPANLYDKDRPFLGCCCLHMRKLVRAHSIEWFPVRHPKDLQEQNFVNLSTHLKEGTIEQEHKKPQNSLSGASAREFSLGGTPQKRTPYLQGQHKCCTPCYKRVFQHTPSELLLLGNQLRQDSGSCPASSCLTAELGSFTAEEVPVPITCKSEQRPEHSLEEPRGPGLTPTTADGSDKQKHLQGISVEAGNPTNNYTSKYVLSENRELPARAKFPHCTGNSGSRWWNRVWLGHPGANENSGVPGTTLKSSATNTSEGVRDGVILLSNCDESALENFLETTPTLSHCDGSNTECEQDLQGDPKAGQGGLHLKPAAGTSMSSDVSDEQTWLQDTRENVGHLPEIQSCANVKERPGSLPSIGVTRCESARTRETLSTGTECGLAACHGLGEDDQSQCPLGQDTDFRTVLSPQDASEEGSLCEDTCSQEYMEEMASSMESVSGEQPGMAQNSGIGDERKKASWSPCCRPAEACCAPGPNHSENQEVQSPMSQLEGPTFSKIAYSCRNSAQGMWTPEGSTPMQEPNSLPPALPDHVEDSPIEDPECPLSPNPVEGPEGLLELPAKCSSEVGSQQWALSPGGPASLGVDRSTSEHIVSVLQGSSQGATGLTEGGNVGTPEDFGHPSPSPKSNSIKGLRSPEKRFRARLALAHKTFSHFFESKVLEKEDTEASSSGQKEKTKARSSSWRTFLRGRDSKGPRRPTLGGPSSGPQALTPPNAVPEQAHSPGSLVFGAHWAPPQSHTQMPDIAMAPVDHRRKSEPTIKCTSSPEGCCPSTDSPDRAWPLLPHSPQAVVSRTQPSSSVCCLTYASHTVPCKPLSPKPCSPRPKTQQLDLHCPGRGSAVSVASLGNYSKMDGGPEAAPERCRRPKARTSLLLSLQTLAGQKEEGKRKFPHRLSTAPSLGHLPVTQVSYCL